jgi:hypothetical protein
MPKSRQTAVVCLCSLARSHQLPGVARLLLSPATLSFRPSKPRARVHLSPLRVRPSASGGNQGESSDCVDGWHEVGDGPAALGWEKGTMAWRR